MVSGLPSLEIKKKPKQLHFSAKDVAIVLLLCFIWNPASLPRSCNVNSLRAMQEVVCLLIGRIPAVCGSVRSAGRPCGSAGERRERERKNAGRPLSTPSAPRPALSVPSCRRLRVSVYSVASGAICKSEFPRPSLFIRATEFTQVKRHILYFAQRSCSICQH